MNDVRVIAMSTNNNNGSVPPVVDVEDFEPTTRDRCNTWPLQKPAGDLGHNTSPLIHEEIPEEEDDLEEDECSLEDGSGGDTLLVNGNNCRSSSDNNSLTNTVVSPTTRITTATPQCLGGKKNSSRRNAWGNLSYADLITQAILGSPDKRLTLSQIYDWMVHNVPYFRDKGDSNSSAGWKVNLQYICTHIYLRQSVCLVYIVFISLFFYSTLYHVVVSHFVTFQTNSFTNTNFFLIHFIIY